MMESILAYTAADPHLPCFERVIYWIPAPIVFFLRFAVFESGGHSATYNALLFAFRVAVPGIILAVASRRDLMCEAQSGGFAKAGLPRGPV